MQYINQDDVFWLTMRDLPYTNPNAAALEYVRTNNEKLYKAYMNSPITNTPARELKKGHRITDVGKATELYDDIWVEVKIGE